jgi:hypothetical protein
MLSAVSPPAARAVDILLQDDFNSENGGVGALNYVGFANWMVTRGSVDLIGNGFFDFYPGNGLYVDLDGSTFSAGRLESRTLFTLAPGDYELRFDLGNNSSFGELNTMTVSLGSVYSEVFSRQGVVPLDTIVRNITVTAPTTGRLVFDQDGGDNAGLIIDNVVLTSLQGAVPEPSAWVLSGLGVLGLLAYGWRRRKTTA